MAKVLMVQGTMSGVGKSLLVAALCRIMKEDGFRVAPFKSQNMALNSYITAEGLEMGRAQVLQAQAACMEPEADMNPILLKPTGCSSSQVIVNGRVIGNMSAREYFAYKKELVPVIRAAFERLSQKADIIVIEGAGSPAEINLRENDIVNMGMAELVDAPVLLVGDIDRGGVFAQLLGTLMLLQEQEKKRVQGLIINKFRGDESLLDSGIRMLEERGKTRVLGVVPYMELSLEDEDSQSSRLDDMYAAGNSFGQEGKEAGEMPDHEEILITVIRFPHISNYTDLQVFEQCESVRVQYVIEPSALEKSDLIVLPGTKNTIADLRWMKKRGFEDAVRKAAGRIPVFGICGGYQMLGDRIEDPLGTESGGSEEGLHLLPVRTILRPDKTQRRVKAQIGQTGGIFSALTGLEAEGYEIHMGKTVDSYPRASQKAAQKDEQALKATATGRVIEFGEGLNVYGTYLHGIFDRGEIAGEVLRTLWKEKKSGIKVTFREPESLDVFRERELDRLAKSVREHLEMDLIYDMLREADIRGI